MYENDAFAKKMRCNGLYPSQCKRK